MGRMKNRREKDAAKLRLLAAIITLATAVVNLLIKLIDWLTS